MKVLSCASLIGSIEETVLELIIETTTRLNSKNAKRK
jgi:hypothetical protein